VSFENDDINIFSHNENIETIKDVEMCYTNDSGFLEVSYIKISKKENNSIDYQ